MRRRMVLATALLLSACGAPQVEVFPSPDASLAARPSAVAPSATSSPRPARPDPAPSASDTHSPAPSAQPAAGGSDSEQAPAVTPPAPTVPAPSGVFHPVGGINDAQGDLPPGAPAWVDIIGLVLEDDGATLRIRIDLADALPEGLRNHETARIGVDLFRGDDGETRYRVYVDGTRDGWLAYLQRPDGFVDYPGSATIAGGEIVLSLPASAVGNPVRGDWRAFAEWSDPGGGRRESRDAAPDEGWGTFTR